MFERSALIAVRQPYSTAPLPPPRQTVFIPEDGNVAHPRTPRNCEPTGLQPDAPAPDSASTEQTLYYCPRCKAKVPPWALYCGNCGYRFAGTKA